METLTFTTGAQFLKWVEQIVKDKKPHYDRVPMPPQIWTYGDGHVEETGYGARGATLLKNLEIIPRTATGELKHEKEARIVGDIEQRGGVTITIDWGE